MMQIFFTDIACPFKSIKHFFSSIKVYIQPFTDGNKRTSRLMANALLISRSLCPLSFRTVEANDYRAALLLFYEQNNLSAFKKMFLEQVEFAMKEYF